jgi:hypothetical protein
MKIFDNVTDIVRDDLKQTVKRGSKVSVAAACFSMYAYKELKTQLEQVDEFGSFSRLRHLSRKRLRSRSANSISRVSAAKAVCTVRNLKSSCVMR